MLISQNKCTCCILVNCYIEKQQIYIEVWHQHCCQESFSEIEEINLDDGFLLHAYIYVLKICLLLL